MALPLTNSAEPAWELKFVLSADSAAAVEEWARSEMRPDPNGDPARGGAYEVSTLYLDTPRFDVFHRAKEFEGGMIRVRMYGTGGFAVLERKKRRRDRVLKRRTEIPAGEVGRLAAGPGGEPWEGDWFRDEVAGGGLRPVCAVAFLRTAFLGSDDAGPSRLNLDRGIRCAPASAWAVPIVDGDAAPVGIPGGGAVCELKFQGAMPRPFKSLVERFRLAPAGLSKYRRSCETLGLVEGGGRADA